MQCIVYCGRFYCKYCEGGKCLSPVLHLGQGQGQGQGQRHWCAEFSPSEEKFDRQMAVLEEKRGSFPPKPVEYLFDDGCTPHRDSGDLQKDVGGVEGCSKR